MIAVITTATADRLAHLTRQVAALRAVPARQLVVTMGGQFDVPAAGAAAWTVHCAGNPAPLAAARNLGARTAIDAGAELLVFLDVDCIPEPGLIDAYRDAAAAHDGLLCGPVTYLPPPPPGGYQSADLVRGAHPARPDPGDVVVAAGPDEYDLFWSLSFAVRPATWQRIGGFCEQYVGYGGEDTDFAQTARSAGIPMWWVGAAHAFHQYHPVGDPPVEHLAEIVANATVFHGRWARWPMRGWLDAFERDGLIRRDRHRIVLTRAGERIAADTRGQRR